MQTVRAKKEQEKEKGQEVKEEKEKKEGKDPALDEVDNLEVSFDEEMLEHAIASAKKLTVEEEMARLLEQDHRLPTYESTSLQNVRREVEEEGSGYVDMNVAYYLLENFFHVKLDEFQKDYLTTLFAGSWKRTYETVDAFTPIIRPGQRDSLPIKGAPIMNYERRTWKTLPKEELCTFGDIEDYLYTLQRKRIDGGGRPKRFELNLKEELDKRKEWGLRYNAASLIIPRRNGKSFIFIAYCIISLLIGRSTFYTSYRESSMREFMDLFSSIIEESPLAKYFVISSKSEKGLKKARFSFYGLKSEVAFATRGGSSARGSGYDSVIFDEANDMSSSDTSVYSPLIGNAKEPQTVYLGTPTMVDKISGQKQFFREQVENNKKSENGLHAEWSIPKIASEEESSDTKVLKRFNPSYGLRMSKENFAGAGDLVAFSVERLGYTFSQSGYDASFFDIETYDKTKMTREEMALLARTGPQYNVSISCDKEQKIFIVSLCAYNKAKRFYPKTLNKDYGHFVFDLLLAVHVEDEEFDEKMKDVIGKYARQLRCRSIIVTGLATTQAKRVLGALGLFYPTTSDKYRRLSLGKVRFDQRRNSHEQVSDFVGMMHRGSASLIDSDLLRRELQMVYPVANSNKNFMGYNANSKWMSTLLEAFSFALTPFIKLK